MVTDESDITVAIEYEVIYELSISIFRFDLDPILKINLNGVSQNC